MREKVNGWSAVASTAFVFAVMIVAHFISPSRGSIVWIIGIILILLIPAAETLGMLIDKDEARKKIQIMVDIINNEYQPLGYVNDAIKGDPDIIQLHELHEKEHFNAKDDGAWSGAMGYIAAGLIFEILYNSNILRQAGIKFHIVKGHSYHTHKEEGRRHENFKPRFFVAAYCKRDRFKMYPIIIDPIGKAPDYMPDSLAESNQVFHGLTIILPSFFENECTIEEIYPNNYGVTIGKATVITSHRKTVSDGDAVIYDIITRHRGWTN